MKNNLIGILDQTYPGVNTYFDSPARNDGSQKWVDFVSTYWSVKCPEMPLSTIIKTGVNTRSTTSVNQKLKKSMEKPGNLFLSFPRMTLQSLLSSRL